MKVKRMESKLLADVNPNLLMKHTEYISSFDRESGSDGEWQAAKYFEKVMTGYGLDVQIKSIENLISLPISAEITLDDGRKVPCITQSYATSAKPGGLKEKAMVLNRMFRDLDDEISRLNEMESLSEADLALPMKPFPGLTDLEKLSAMDHSSIEFKALERQLIRERNRISHSLKEAITLINNWQDNRSNLS